MINVENMSGTCTDNKSDNKFMKTIDHLKCKKNRIILFGLFPHFFNKNFLSSVTRLLIEVDFSYAELLHVDRWIDWILVHYK